MALPLTIQDLIDAYSKNEKSYRNLHEQAIIYLSKPDEYIRVPYGSITNKYRDFLAASQIVIALDDSQVSHYRYNPRLLAKDLYGTAELWYMILELNNLSSVIEFRDIEYINIYQPDLFYKMINEIMIMENII